MEFNIWGETSKEECEFVFSFASELIEVVKKILSKCNL